MVRNGKGGEGLLPSHLLRAPGSHSTKSTSPGVDDAFIENNGNEKLLQNVGLMEPDSGTYGEGLKPKKM